MFGAQLQSRPSIEFSWAPLFEDYGIPLAVMGILVVFSALALVVAFITILPRVVQRLTGGERAAEATAWSAVAEDELSDETLVVITAAVASVLDQPHRIVSIRGLTPEQLGWSLEGRIQHHQSHRIPPRDRL